jgi:flavin-dependent dehydrogenase
MYDAIIIGARCAGATTAMLLARKGLKVLLVDRATFPSEIPHGHLIRKLGTKRLADWGLLDRVLATNCPPVTSWTTDFGDFRLVGSDLGVEGVPMSVGPRRSRLDQVLIEAAVDAGVELRVGFAVHDLIAEGDRITGIRGRDVAGGSTLTEQAAVVIGADGRNSLVARTVDAPAYEMVPTLSCWYFSYWSGVEDHGLELIVRNRRAIFAFPTNDELFAVFVAWPAEELSRVRADIESELIAVVDGIPELSERVRSGRREERFYGATQLPNFLRRPYGPGWALVGDAGCHKDPFSALGICDALRDADLLAEAIHLGLSGAEPMQDALAGYEARRNAATMGDYQENLGMAQLKGPPPDVYALRAALRGHPADTNHFYLAREGLLPEESFFNDENLARLMGPVEVAS